nr:unnamed protein product [Callosobruchus analis]
MDLIMNDELDNDDLIALNLLEHGIPRRIYERHEYFDTMDAVTFRKRFRLPKHTVQSFLEEIREKLKVSQNM